MFNHISLAVSLITLFVALPTYAQSTLTATIPFDFTAGPKHFQAGDYVIRFNIANGVQVARSDGKASCMILTTASENRTMPAAGKLVFNRYGDYYFLSRIVSPGVGQSKVLPKTKSELERASLVNNVEHTSVASRELRNSR